MVLARLMLRQKPFGVLFAPACDWLLALADYCDFFVFCYFWSPCFILQTNGIGHSIQMHPYQKGNNFSGVLLLSCLADDAYLGHL